MDNLQALHSFWSGFGLKAYDENTVPAGAALPYLTYSVSDGFFGDSMLLSASLWYKSTSWADITAKSAEIGSAIGSGGTLVPFDGGSIWIKRGTPFAQRMSDPDDTIRRIYINIDVEFFRE